MKAHLLGFLLLTTIAGWSASIQEFAKLSDFRMAGKNDSQLIMLPWPGTETEKVSCRFPPAENPGAVQIVCEWNAARHHPLPQTPFLLQLEAPHTEPQPFSRLDLSCPGDGNR